LAHAVVAIEHVCARYTELRDRLSPIVAAGEAGARCQAVHTLLGRGSNHIAAARALLRMGLWESATIIIRALLEDAATLKYVESRRDDADDLARLYLLSEVTDRVAALTRIEELTREQPPATQTRNLRQLASQFDELKRRLWDGPVSKSGQPAYDKPHSWCGWSIREMFSRGGLGPMYRYWYWEMCGFSHGSAFTASYAYPDELRGALALDTAEAQRKTEVALVVAVALQIDAAQELLDVDGVDVDSLLRKLLGLPESECTNTEAP